MLETLAVSKNAELWSRYFREMRRKTTPILSCAKGVVVPIQKICSIFSYRRPRRGASLVEERRYEGKTKERGLGSDNRGILESDDNPQDRLHS